MAIVQLPNGQKVQFPDDTPHDVMVRAIHEKFPEYRPEENQQQQKAQETSNVAPNIALLELLKLALSSKLHQYRQAVQELPGKISEGKDLLLSNPLRALGQTGAGYTETLKQAVNFLPDILGMSSQLISPYKSQPSLRIGDTGIQQALFGEQRPGDELFQLLGEGLALTNPGAISQGIGKAARSIGNKAELGFRNKILDKAQAALAESGAYTPEQTIKNIESNYLGAEGERLPVDFGTATGYKPAQDIYKITSKIPFTKGNVAKQEVIAGRQARAEKEALENVQKHKSALQEKQVLTNEDQKQLSNEIANLSKDRNQFEKIQSGLTSQQSMTGKYLADTVNKFNDLSLNTQDIPRSLKQRIAVPFENAKARSNSLYEPVNNYNADLRSFSTPEDFANYNRYAEQLGSESRNLKDAFGADVDLGNKVSREINQQKRFFRDLEEGETYKPLTTKNITDHVKTLQRAAARATESGNRTEGAILNKMASGLKNDLIKILNDNGASDIATALREADMHYISDVLPYYQNKEIRDTVTKNNFIPDPNKLAKVLHDPNLANITRGLDDEAKKHLIFELLTKGKYSARGNSDLSAVDIAKNYQSLDAKTRRVIRDVMPEQDAYFENLNNIVRSFVRNSDQITALDREISGYEKRLAKKGISQTEINKAKSDLEKAEKKLEQVILKRFDNPNIKRPSVTDVAHNLNPLKAGGFGMLASSLTGLAVLPVKKLAESITLAIPVAKRVNKILTEPEFADKFIQNERYKSLPKKELTQEELKIKELRKNLSRGAVLGEKQIDNQEGK